MISVSSVKIGLRCMDIDVGCEIVIGVCSS